MSQYAAPMMSGRQTLRHIGVGSAFKVMAVLSGLIWIIIGFFVVILSLCGAFSAASSINRYGYSSSSGGGVLAGGIVLLFIYVVGVIIYAIIGGLLGALYAWLYNVTTRMTGGLEVEIS